MARKTRIAYPGAYYHVINRGNYRSWIFESLGARVSFLECLSQTCESMGWRLHGWCLMGNHYHLCIETPSPNLVEGMKWLQSTFANRFNRFRKSNGHVFAHQAAHRAPA
jgi:REP element-mobilizing transposase RayT